MPGSSIHSSTTRGRPLTRTTATGVPVATAARTRAVWPPGRWRSARLVASPVSCFLVRLFGVGNGGDDQVSQLDEGVLEALAIDQDLLHRIMDGLERDFVDLV